ncbi:hypothetical protein LTR85_000619 [Meristemomyces frigidus]|nr:hypothetical protein LTR85_000619 [Meristemomyces frigidus]
MTGGISAPLQEHDLIFPTATHDIKTALTSLKRSNLSITNRLHSIKADADFVQSISKPYQLPLIANERCGSWYINPASKAGSAYFKSTDGHFGQWSFSLRRLNLQVLDVVGRCGGCIIVDSTRRGKSMPDALSKTVPIWLCVLNRLLYPEQADWHALHTPPDVVSDSEHSQIEARIPSLVEAARGLALDVETLRSKLAGKPLQPVWVTPRSNVAEFAAKDGCHTVVLCTASSRESEHLHQHSSTSYVQGAADDSESWAHGLDATTFWAHHSKLLSTSEDELPSLIQDLMAKSRLHNPVREPVLIKPTSNLWIANNAAAEALYADFDLIISCSPKANPAVAEALKSRYVHLTCSTGKIGSRQLRAELPRIESLRCMLDAQSRVLVTCETGRDLAVGVALAIICLFFKECGSLQSSGEGDGAATSALSKAVIKHRLSWIMVSMPDAAPSRATLQSVNAFLLA